MKTMVLILAIFAFAIPVSVPASAHHAEHCKVQAAKQASKGQKPVRVAKNCMVTRAHDRETAKR